MYCINYYSGYNPSKIKMFLSKIKIKLRKMLLRNSKKYSDIIDEIIALETDLYWQDNTNKLFSKKQFDQGNYLEKAIEKFIEEYKHKKY